MIEGSIYIIYNYYIGLTCPMLGGGCWDSRGCLGPGSMGITPSGLGPRCEAGGGTCMDGGGPIPGRMMLPGMEPGPGPCIRMGGIPGLTSGGCGSGCCAPI